MSVHRLTTFSVDGVEVLTESGVLSIEDRQLAVSLTILKELRTMATISDQALADLQAAAAANKAHDDAMTAKVDAAIQLINDLKAAVGAQGQSADAQLAAVTALLNSGAAADIANEAKIDAAIAPAP